MIIAIYRASERRALQTQHSSVELKAGQGIVGDRNFAKNKHPGQNITFIEQEEIDAFNSQFAQNIEQSATRRNVITTGIRLNDLVGKEFMIGNAKFIGIELCEPCKLLGNDLANASIDAKTVLNAFITKGGLRANCLTDGTIATGMTFSVLR